MMPLKIKIGVCQTNVTRDEHYNRQQALQAIEQVTAQGAQLVLLPEMFGCPYDLDSMARQSEETTRRLLEELQEYSQTYQIVLVAGTVVEHAGAQRYNTSYIFDQGKFIGKYRKYHLFDIAIAGKISFQESSLFTPGEELGVFDTHLGRLGLAICFDLRFPELFKLIALQQALIICVPGAFNHVTGPLHWELCLRARAVDSQSFVVACSPACNPQLGYRAWGHSALIHPMGQVIRMLDSQPGQFVEEIELAEATRARSKLPLLHHTRLLPRGDRQSNAKTSGFIASSG